MKILLLANYGMGLYKFRKELLEELIKQGNDVYISLPNDEYVTKLKELGCKYIETSVDRHGTNFITDLKLLLSYIKIINKNKPDIVLTYTVKPNIYGGITCRITNIPYLANITGLGTSIENAGLMQKIILCLYKVALKKCKCVFFQNEPNRQFFINKRIVKSRTRLIPGSGVNLTQHKLEEYPKNDDQVRLIFIGRIMKSKGIEELLEAAKRIKSVYPNVQFDIIGFCEEDYGTQLDGLVDEGIINYYGQQDDVHSFIKNSHATILPSYHEGTANVLLESASSGRPVLASKVTGCQETFDEGISGLGFEVKNIDSLVYVITEFLKLPLENKKEMGLAGRRKMEKEYDRMIVIDAYMKELKI